VQEQETAIRTSLAGLNVQQALQTQVLQAVHEQSSQSATLLSEQGPIQSDESISYRPPGSQALATVLEVGVLSLGLTGEKSVNPSLALTMTARAKLIRSVDDSVLYHSTFECRSYRRAFSQWAASNAQAVREEYKQCLQRLSDKIVEEVFTLSYFPSTSSELPYPIYGLRPEYPEVNYATFILVDSLRPTLRWEAFPRLTEIDTRMLQSQISHMTYDLKIWRAEGKDPGTLVYARENLSAPLHQIEEPLEPATEYFWTVRVRYALNGQPRRSEWGLAGDSSARSLTVPNLFCYRFLTPSRGRDKP